MKRSLLAVVAALVVVAGPAQAKLVDLTASPNPANVGNQVRHTVSLGAPTRLELYVSAAGFERPGTGTLPAGSWTYRCCPAQTAGTPAWYYRANAGVSPRLVPVRRGGADPRAVPVDGDHRPSGRDILVLGAAQYDGDPSPVFAGRLEHAQLLYDEGRSDTIVVLGGGAPGDRTTEAEAGRDWLVAQGVPAEAVVASPVGSTTLESLEAAAAWMNDRGMASAFLVSDPWHNLRVKRMASDLGLEAYASATWHSAARTEGTRVGGYLRETLAYMYYRLFGR